LLILSLYSFSIYPACLFLHNTVSPRKHFECNSRAWWVKSGTFSLLGLRVDAGGSRNEQRFFVF
jgi:hypothetical protein